LLHLVGSSILFYVIDDARTNTNQVVDRFSQQDKVPVHKQISVGQKWATT